MEVDTYYPDIIRQSTFGRWEVIRRSHDASCAESARLCLFYPGGKSGRFFHIDPVSMYELLRVTGAIFIFIATYLLITQLLPPTYHVVAILLTLVVDTGPLVMNMMNTSIFGWTAANPSQFTLSRHFGLPHHLWGEAMGLMLIYMTFRAIKKPSNWTLFTMFLFGFIGTVTLPSYFVIIAACVFMPWILYAFVTKTTKQTLLPVIFSILVILAAGLWVKYEFDKGPPWNALVAVEKSWWSTSEVIIPYVQSFALFYPFILALLLLVPTGFSRWSKSLRQSVFLSVSWSVLPVVLIYMSKASWFPVANGRIATDLSPVPFGLCATLGVYALWQKIRHIPRAKPVAITLFSIFMAISLFFSFLYFRQTLAAQDKAVFNEGYSWTLYPTYDVWNGMMALKGVPPFSHVMINPRIGELITAYLPLRVYQSAPLTFTDWLVRRVNPIIFIRGRWRLTICASCCEQIR